MTHTDNFLIKFLVWCRLVDPHDGLLSLTNIAVMVALFKIAMVVDVTVTELTTLLGCLGFYQMKRVFGKRAKAEGTEPALAIKALEEQVQAMGTMMQGAKDAAAEAKAKVQIMLDTVALSKR